MRKASLAAENDEAAGSEPGLILAKWPETCLLVSCWLNQYELSKALLDRGVNVNARDGDGRYVDDTVQHLLRGYMDFKVQKKNLFSLILLKQTE